MFFKPQSYIGIDIGTSSIKLVELAKEESQLKLLTYGSLNVESNIVKHIDPQVELALSESIKILCREAKTKSKHAVAAIPGFTVFTAVMALPNLTDKEIPDALKYEARRFISVNLDDMILDWKVIKREETNLKEGIGTSKMKVLLTAAPKGIVNRYVDLFRLVDLKLESLETESFSLIRSLVGNDPSPLIIIDMGATATDFIIVNKGYPILHKSFDFGGKLLDSAFKEKMNIDSESAEQFKRDFGIPSSLDKMSGGLRTSFESLLGSMDKTLEMYYNKKGRKIERMILAGGCATIPGLKDLLSSKFNVKVFIGDPWARINYDPSFKASLEKLSPSFAVAVGLAMREII